MITQEGVTCDHIPLAKEMRHGFYPVAHKAACACGWEGRLFVHDMDGSPAECRTMARMAAESHCQRFDA